MAKRFRDMTVGMRGVVNDKHFWIARDGRAWSFVMVEVTIDGAVEGLRLAFLANEDDINAAKEV